MNKTIRKIIKSIEAKNETVNDEGLFCQALIIKDGILLWQKQLKWLRINKNCRKLSILKDDHIKFLNPELKEILKQIEIEH